MIFRQNLKELSQDGDTKMRKDFYDYAAEMVKIANSQEHQEVFGVKTAFSRDGKEFGKQESEVEAEFNKLANKDCDCKEDCENCDCNCHEEKGEKKEASADESLSLEDAAGMILEISDHLDNQGENKLAAATIFLAESMIKEAAKKKKEDKKSKSKSSGNGKKMSLKERMEKLRKAKDKSKSKSSDSKKS